MKEAPAQANVSISSTPAPPESGASPSPEKVASPTRKKGSERTSPSRRPAKERSTSASTSTEAPPKKSRKKKDAPPAEPIGGVFGALAKVDHFGVEENFGEAEYQRIASKGDKIVAITGEPGVGKTTTAEQLAARLQHDGKRVVQVIFDEVKDEFEGVFGLPCASWSRDQWDTFSHELTDRALHPPVLPVRRSRRKDAPDTVVIVDAVAMGKRGGMLMEALAQKSREDPESVHVLRFASVEHMQLQAGKQRETVLSAPAKKVVDLFSTIYHTVFEYADAAISNTQLGNIIKERVGKSASLAAIVKIIKETRDFVRDLLSGIPYAVINHIELPKSLQNLAKDAQHRIKRSIFAWVEYFSHLGFAPGSAHVVLNQKQEKVQHYLQVA